MRRGECELPFCESGDFEQRERFKTKMLDADMMLSLFYGDREMALKSSEQKSNCRSERLPLLPV